MSLTYTERNLNISQVVAILCEANAIARSCNTCGPAIPGVNFTNLLIQLQLEYPENTWDADQLNTTLTYMRQRGIAVFLNGQYFLNYDMISAGGGNIQFAVQCSKVRQPINCVTTQATKFGWLPPVRMVEDPCFASNPADGCCPPLNNIV